MIAGPPDRQKYYEQVLEAAPEIASALQVRLTPYIPHTPTPRQRLFLLLPQREALFGGAAGGGKSDALLMGALQYVDVPKFSAVIFRKTLRDLNLPGALLDRSREWLDGTDAKYKDYCWWFPSGARVQFAYLDSELDRYKYQGAEFQYVAFDEVTQFWEEDYLYLRSRLRRVRCPFHGGNVVDGVNVPLPDDPDCPTCREFAAVSRVPLRMRCAANPGGVGHLWVKKRFNIGPIVEDYERGQPVLKSHPKTGKTLYVGRNHKRPFVPALVQDNPYLDQAEYIESLRELDPVTREQLMSGDWSISADGRFRKSWVRYYSVNGPYIILGQNRIGQTFRLDQCETFTITDPAASTREGPGDAQVWKGSPSWNVIGTFLLTPDNNLIWWDLRRFRDEVNEVYQALKKNFRQHQPVFTGMEVSSLSIHLYQMCQRAGLPMKQFKPGSQDKLSRATDAINRMEQGRVWFPQTAPWLEDLEAEIFTWTAHPHEQDDQIDTLAYAAMYVSERAAYARGEDNIHDSLHPHMLEEMTPGTSDEEY